MQLLNKAHTKRFILEKLKAMRPGMPITRVSAEALEWYEARLRSWIVDDVKRHPSTGKTFKDLVSKANCNK